MSSKNIFFGWIAAFLLAACSSGVQPDRTLSQLPDIFPDYVDVTIPPNVAPLNFHLQSGETEAQAAFVFNKKELVVKTRNGAFRISPSDWKEMLSMAVGESITVTVTARQGKEWVGYEPFLLRVAHESMDSHLAYRLIEPGYEIWNQMGIYQRNLETFEQTAIMENKLTDFNCMNCHSFCMQDPGQMLFHMRANNAGTYLVQGDKVEKLNTKTDQTMSALVYPSWHPSGKYVAFSVNDTKQSFHMNHRNRIEVFDEASDVVVYDIEKHEIVTTPPLFSKDRFETFPTFSPDGKTLYFCSAAAHPMPAEFTNVRYSLCSIDFDPEARTFGQTVDTLYNATDSTARSVSFPRVSPDGKYLLFTLSNYGNFSIWHREADLYLVDLSTKAISPLPLVNSDETESYHSWSSNSRWFTFSSRRVDGLYTRPFFAYIDEKGEAAKPFLLPQKDSHFYERFLKSYNIPEFITGPVKQRKNQLQNIARNDKGIDVTFASN